MLRQFVNVNINVNEYVNVKINVNVVFIIFITHGNVIFDILEPLKGNIAHDGLHDLYDLHFIFDILESHAFQKYSTCRVF